MLTGTDTMLVLGTDQRPKGSKEPGANTSDKGSRSDTIMLWRIGGGVSRRLSIPRDTVAQIPGYGSTKINAAYAYGGPALAIKTMEQFTGVKINHLIIVNLANFPKFIDAIGGVTVKTGRICSKISGGAKNGGFSLYLKPGTHQLTGIQALTLARTRENCATRPATTSPARAPAEDPQRDQVQAAVPDDLLPPALGVVVRAADGAHGHGRLHPAEPVRRLGDRRLGADGDPPPERLGDAGRRRGRAGRVAVGHPPGVSKLMNGAGVAAGPPRLSPAAAFGLGLLVRAAGFLELLGVLLGPCEVLVLGGLGGLLLAGALAGAVVGVVEARALEVHRDRVKHPLERAARRPRRW